MHAVKFVLQHGEAPKPLESVYDNVFWAGAVARLSIVIPSWRHDASELIDALARCAASPLAEIIVYDDGACDNELLAQMHVTAGSARAAVRVVSSPTNRGRAAARNAAARHARAAWILLLDADMSPDTMNFIDAYLQAEEQLLDPSIVVGGHSLRFAPDDKDISLHRWQYGRSECVNAETRRKAPGQYVSSSNVMVHREVLEACPFDESFEGWGWEDADWGLKVQARFPVMHIDNATTHLGLECDKALMAKYAKSGVNFARLVKRHPEHAATMPLYRAATTARRLPFRKLFRALAGGVAASRLFPTGLRGRALKAWRALVYAEAL